jgi:hypothetical protein
MAINYYFSVQLGGSEHGVNEGSDPAIGGDLLLHADIDPAMFGASNGRESLLLALRAIQQFVMSNTRTPFAGGHAYWSVQRGTTTNGIEQTAVTVANADPGGPCVLRANLAVFTWDKRDRLFLAINALMDHIKDRQWQFRPSGRC